MGTPAVLQAVTATHGQTDKPADFFVSYGHGQRISTMVCTAGRGTFKLGTDSGRTNGPDGWYATRTYTVIKEGQRRCSMRRLGILVLLILMAAGCGEATDGSTAAPTVTVSTTTAAASTLPETVATTATTVLPASEVAPGERLVCGQPVGTRFSQVDCGGMVFDVAVPEICPEGSCGLIVDVHGYGGDGAITDRHTDLQRLGTDAGYVVVQPNSPGIGWDYEVDAPQIRSFLDELIAALDIDPDRVHIGGMSQGGYMTWVFICDHADLIASAAPLSGDENQDMWCGFRGADLPSEEVDILLAHGRNDFMVPFDTAIAQRDLVVAAWDMTEEETVADEPTYRWTRWTNPRGTVFEFLEFDWTGGQFGGHCYPGVTAFAGCGSDTPIHYGQAALEFYIAHPKGD